MFMNFADVISTVAFIGFGGCVLGACIDYCDWLVIGLIILYLIIAVVSKVWAIKMYREKLLDNTEE